eukprot:scaffold6.g2509.t1
MPLHPTPTYQQCTSSSQACVQARVQARPVAAQMVPSRPAAQLQRSAAPSSKPAMRRAVPAVTTKAAAAEAPVQGTVVNGKAHWYAVVASAEFFFNDVQNEPFAEQLREKKRFYDEQGKEADFFLAVEPAWLQARYPEVAKRCRRPAVALLSPDKAWMTFMKVRLDRVLWVDLGELTVDEAAKSTAEVPKFPPPEKWIAPYAPYAWGWWEVFQRK